MLRLKAFLNSWEKQNSLKEVFAFLFWWFLQINLFFCSEPYDQIYTFFKNHLIFFEVSLKNIFFINLLFYSSIWRAHSLEWHII